ncbi:MAG: InlB B-repeat-containing protein [Nitrososphaerota archaeon]|jgi:uncharacterized repeat protein (TIGR02543 family)|nr:InlB B-repeat-containing protein [Nitrososphaerota archaeon]
MVLNYEASDEKITRDLLSIDSKGGLSSIGVGVSYTLGLDFSFSLPASAYPVYSKTSLNMKDTIGYAGEIKLLNSGTNFWHIIPNEKLIIVAHHKENKNNAEIIEYTVAGTWDINYGKHKPVHTYEIDATAKKTTTIQCKDTNHWHVNWYLVYWETYCEYHKRAGAYYFEPNCSYDMVKVSGQHFTGTSGSVAHTIVYLANDGTNAPTDTSSPYTTGTEVTVLGQNSMTRSGYTFQGWVDSTSGQTYLPGSTFAIKEDTILVAVWSQNPVHSVNYATHYEASDIPTGDNYIAGTAVKISDVVPTRAGYTFAGWLYNGVTYRGGNTFTMPFANITLVAQCRLFPCIV